MIAVLHGDDIGASYARLLQLKDSYKDHQKVSLAKTTPEEILQNIQSQDLLGQEKLLVVENFFAPQKKLNVKFFSQIPKDANIIFWEKSTLTPAKINHLEKIGKLEFFKQKQDLFPFIDNIGINLKSSLVTLSKLQNADGLIWQIENRLLLMLLAKLNVDLASVVQITKRKVFDWQWDRVKRQAQNLSLQNLKNAYSASLKLDLITKTGRTDLDSRTLISAFLIKYLR